MTHAMHDAMRGTALVTAVLLIAWLLIACVLAWLDDRRTR